MDLDLLFIIYLYLQLSSQVLTATLKQGTVPEHVYLFSTLLISLLSSFNQYMFVTIGLHYSVYCGIKPALRVHLLITPTSLWGQRPPNQDSLIQVNIPLCQV